MKYLPRAVAFGKMKAMAEGAAIGAARDRRHVTSRHSRGDDHAICDRTDLDRRRARALERIFPDPRLKQVMTALVKRAHAFVREIEPTPAEWATAIDFLTRTGQMCDDKRQEFILMSDVLGISMLVDAINHRQANGATPSTVEGPFHVPDAPAVANGGNMAVERARHSPASSPARCTASRASRCPARYSICGRPTAMASTRRSVRRSKARGCRGLYRSQPDGSYLIRTVAPIAYTIPMDGTIGELMNRTNLRPHATGAYFTSPSTRRAITAW